MRLAVRIAACSLWVLLGCRAPLPPPVTAQDGIQLGKAPFEERPVLQAFKVGGFLEPSHRILTEIDDQTQLLLYHLIEPGVTIEAPVVALRLVNPNARQTAFGARMGVIARRVARGAPRNSRYLPRAPRVACAAFVSAMSRKAGGRAYSYSVTQMYAQMRKRGARLVASRTSTRYSSFFRWFRSGDCLFFHKSGGRMGHVEIYVGSGLTAGTSSSMLRVGIRRVGNRGFRLMSVVRL